MVEDSTTYVLFAPDADRAAVLSAPPWHVAELDDGAVLLVAHPNPYFPDFETVDAIVDGVGAPLRTYWS